VISEIGILMTSPHDTVYSNLNEKTFNGWP